MESAKFTCPLTDRCSFYRRSKGFMPNISRQLKEQFCHNDNSGCACLKLHNLLGPESVPLQMLPYHHEWAEDILADLAHSQAPDGPARR